MTENLNDADTPLRDDQTPPGVAYARYVGGGDDENPMGVSLPGSINAVPSVVTAGDVFAYDDTFSDDLLGSASFEAATVDDYTPPETFPNTAARRKLKDEGVDVRDDDSDEVSSRNLSSPDGGRVASSDPTPVPPSALGSTPGNEIDQ